MWLPCFVVPIIPKGSLISFLICTPSMLGSIRGNHGFLHVYRGLGKLMPKPLPQASNVLEDSKVEHKNIGSRDQTLRLVLLFPSSMTLEKLLNLSEPQFCHL